MSTRVFYICDRRACEKCMPPCTHTSDVRHAVNFSLAAVGDLWEREEGEDILTGKSFSSGRREAIPPDFPCESGGLEE